MCQRVFSGPQAPTIHRVRLVSPTPLDEHSQVTLTRVVPMIDAHDCTYNVLIGPNHTMGGSR